MNALIVKVLAVGLTLSQLFNHKAEDFKTAFDPQTDQAKVEQLLQEGCQFMIKEFKAEDVDFDFLFTMMVGNMESERAKAQKRIEELGTDGGTKSLTDKLFEQMDLPTMHAAYKRFCKNEKGESSAIKLNEVIEYYNLALADLPDHHKLNGIKLKEASVLLDQNDQKFTEIYSDQNRRRLIHLGDLPVYVKQAFVAAEDQHFFQHNGLDIRGIVRAFSSNFSGGKGRPQGGSTITQQVVKNLLVGDDLTFERKIKEMVLATRVEQLWPKPKAKENIIELYLNYVFLGRASWGIEMAAQSYFGKSAKSLSVSEAAFLAGLTRGPNYYHPDRHPERALARRQYVLGRMKEDGYIDEPTFIAANAEKINLIPYEPPSTRGGYYFIDEINRQVKKLLNGPSLTSASYTVYATLDGELQKASDRALQNGLLKYEAESGRATAKQAVQGNIAGEIAKFKTTWRETLPKIRPKLFDVQWPLAVVTQTSGRVTVERGGRRSTVNQGVKVGLADGRELSLSGQTRIQATLKLYDLVFVQVIESKKNPRAELRLPPTVQGAIVVLENRTGKVLAMSGGFSYAQSQLNRVTQTARQPGSTLKPFIYLSALNLGYQPNTLIPDVPVEFPPIARGGSAWIPKNYDGGSRGLVTIRQALEQSLNLPTARMMAALGNTPAEGLDYVRGITQDIGIYKTTERFYPFVLGAQPARLIDMAVAYATIANLGLKPTPQFIEKLVKDGQIVYQRPRFNLQPLNNFKDRVAFYQLRRILEGTLVRGTATRIKDMAGAVAGKTGTSNDENDAWFCGFTNDITVAVWVGYDSRRVRANLGGRFTGGRVALPIAESVLRSSFQVYKPKQPFNQAPPEILEQTVEMPIDNSTGESGAGDFMEVFRLEPGTKRPRNTRTQILTPNEVATMPLTFPAGEEDNVNQLAGLDDYENSRNRPQAEVTADIERYQPGNEDLYEGWNQHNRKVDPAFTAPVFYKMRED